MSSINVDEQKSKNLRSFARRGLAIFAFVTAVCLVLIAVGSRSFFPGLKNRYATIAFLILYLNFLGSIVYQIRVCYLLAPTLEQKQKLLRTLIWPALLSILAFIRFGEAIQNDTRYGIEFWTDFGPLFVYQALVSIIESLLKSSVPKPPEKLAPDLPVDPNAWRASE